MALAATEQHHCGHSGAIGVYVHVPWCRAKCDYCAFVSQPIYDARLVEAVVEHSVVLLQRRLRLCGNPRVDTVYVGGGTPTVLSAALLQRLLGGIAACVGPRVREWTVEANPDNVTDLPLGCLAHCGVTRLSIGIQSFQPRLLHVLGRSCRTVDPDRALSALACRWSGQWSLDLISGIVDQSVLEATDDVERAVGYGPPHISLYDLTIEPGTPLARRLGRPAVSAFVNRAALTSATAAGVLQRCGYRRYEVSSYARAGAESLHNGGYWAMRDFIGVGPSAVSALSRADGTVVRYCDPSDIPAFLLLGRNGGCWGRAERVNRRSLILERAMLGLRSAAGVSPAEITGQLDRAGAAAVRQLLQRWAARGDARLTATRLTMTTGGWQRLDFCLRELAALIGLS